MKKATIAKAIVYLVKPAIIPASFLALPILASLTLTSNNYSIKKLGFQKWKNLHKKVYLAEFAAFIHIMLMGNKLYAVILFVPVFILQFIRIMSRYFPNKS